MCKECLKLKEENEMLREKLSLSEVENMRKNHLILRTALNQAESIKMWKELENVAIQKKEK